MSSLQKEILIKEDWKFTAILGTTIETNRDYLQKEILIKEDWKKKELIFVVGSSLSLLTPCKKKSS